MRRLKGFRGLRLLGFQGLEFKALGVEGGALWGLGF